jgi:glutamyl-tRNA reductase
MYEKFRVVGVSHHHTPLEAREVLSISEDAGRKLTRTLKEVLGLDELMFLSTCNRTEIYYSSDNDLSKEIVGLFLVQIKNVNDLFRSYFQSFEGHQAIRHLYEVSLGLDAKVLGDIQIANQIKRAYQASADEQLAGPFLHRLMHAIFFANKRVVQETAFRDGAASTSYASVDLAEQFISNFKEPKILVLGVGEIGEDVAGNLAGASAKVTLANRTYEKAEELAFKYGYEAISLERALDNLAYYDVIISSVAVSKPIISSEKLDPKKLNMKLLIDLSVPRSIDPAVESIPGVLLYNIDQIEQKTTSIQALREKAIPEVVRIMEESITELSSWAQEMEFSPTIKRLKQALDEIRREEITRFLKNADQNQYELVDKVTKSIVQKVIKLPVLQLKAACKRGESETLVEVLNDLFNLEDQSVKEPSTDK